VQRTRPRAKLPNGFWRTFGRFSSEVFPVKLDSVG
jgi:hypothetical protein